MDKLTKIRLAILGTLFGAILLVLGKSIFLPNTKERAFTPFTFPEKVSLQNNWQFSGSNPIEKPENAPKNNAYISGTYYRYAQKNVPLDIEMRYVAKTSGDPKEFIKKYTAISSASDRFKPIVRQQEGVGFYNLFVDGERAYLLACINSRGGSTATLEQFDSNRNKYDMRLDRVVPWLLGQSDIRDRRCLWTLLSTPLKKSSPEDAYKTLEKAWFDWYAWWMQNYPKE